MSVIPVTWEAEIGGSWSRASPGKIFVRIMFEFMDDKIGETEKYFRGSREDCIAISFVSYRTAV
jgi:hypothetical protein